MQVLYLAQQYDYGDPSRGHSFEHHNFYRSLCAMGFDVNYFDYPSMVQAFGRSEANRRLEEQVFGDKPELLFAVLQHDAIDKRVIRRISDESSTTTVNWFCDDHWQFESLGKIWTPCFNYVVTTSQSALAKYQACGFHNVIKSQWAANHTLYQPTNHPPNYDVTFVGQPYGMRQPAIRALERAGVKVNTWGNGWPGGKVDQDEMINIFASSQINLNFADASSNGHTRLEKIAASHAVASMKTRPVLWRAWSGAQRAAAWSKQRAERNHTPPPRQIKGRVFEVPACGGFLLTQPAENLGDYLTPGVDCATFETIDDLVDQVRYYLAHEEERLAAADSGYQRVVNEHTYAKRFEEIFKHIGLSNEASRMRTAA